MKLRHFHSILTYPPKEPPVWAPQVERWYQLDPYAYLLPEAFSQWEKEVESRPDVQFLASGGASNVTDQAFVMSRATSPTKFVHTLPNIRSSSLLAVMRWEGPVFSLHRDPHTLAAAFREAIRRWERDPLKESWIWSVGDQSESRSVDLWILGGTKGANAPFRISPRIQDSRVYAEPEDMAILRWFWDSKGDFDVSRQWTVRIE